MISKKFTKTGKEKFLKTILMSNNLSSATVKVVLPNYNSAAYVSKTIDSVINQTFKNWKLTIVDDNSNTETRKVLRNYIDHPNINIIWLKKNKRT